MIETETTTDTTNASHDAAAVAAIRAGDAERYAELVNRHQRRVFAIAWSRLGDAALAEEACQEAFIRAYRRLWLLGDGRKYGAWIASIARNMAINVGLRRRRELERHERWSLELSNLASEETTEGVTAETLRETLEALPAKHRECLVLFYLEGKGGEEAAAALGISEAAFRVRLHRAKAALREHLEQTLSDSLEKLRPSNGLLAGVMAAVLTSSSGKAATIGAGATIAGTVTKYLPVGWIIPYFSWLVLVPTFLLASFYLRVEGRNYRDPEGFRARLFQEGSRKRILFMLPFLFGMFWVLPQFSAAFGFHAVYVCLGFTILLTVMFMVRKLAICRNRFAVLNLAGSTLLAVGTLAVGFRLLPLSFVQLVVMFAMVLGAVTFGQRPMRMDYSLFLRAAAGLLRRSQSEPVPLSDRLSRHDFLLFARFLGDRWLVTNFRWLENGLLLQAAPIQSWQFGLFNFLRRWSHGSQILLSFDGDVKARLAERQGKEIQQLREEKIDAELLEGTVSASVRSAWAEFRAGRLERAEAYLGQESEQEVFKVPPARSGATRWHRRITLTFTGIFAVLWTLNYLRPPWMSGLKPLNLTEAEVRNALANFGAPQNWHMSNGVVGALTFNLVLPGPELFSPAALEQMREEVFHVSGFKRNIDPTKHYPTIENGWLLTRALNAGWITPEQLGVSTDGFKAYLTERKEDGWKFLLARYQQGDGSEGVAKKFNPAILARLQWFQRVGCLDLIDREELIRQTAWSQVVSESFPDGTPRMRNWRNLRGLFVTGVGSVLQDTYCHLAALEILGGLDRIDREACIRAILKMHRSRGFFAPPDTEDNWKYQVRGDGRDTYCAFKSLQILGALDRVKDLASWKFRPSHRSEPGPDRQVRWIEVEAWLCQQELARALN